jgi:hypothetical protein
MYRPGEVPQELANALLPCCSKCIVQLKQLWTMYAACTCHTCVHFAGTQLQWLHGVPQATADALLPCCTAQKAANPFTLHAPWTYVRTVQARSCSGRVAAPKL